MIKLSNEVTEYLITNLRKEEMPAERFKELYFLRWGAESKYQANRSYITECINNLLEIIILKKVNIQKEIEDLIKRSKKKRSLIRPNRKNERNKNLNRQKHDINYKPCI